MTDSDYGNAAARCRGHRAPRARSPRRCARSCPGEGVIVSEPERRAYESDGLTAYRQPPLVVGAALDRRPGRRGAALLQGRRASRWCRAAPAPRCRAARCRWPTACCSAWPSSTAFSRSITTNRCAVVQPGVTNLGISHAVEAAGFYYAPDPSSQIACTIGGNVAENSGGVHCLKYGLTTNNLLGIEMVTDRRRGDPPRRQAPRRRGLRSAGRDDRLRGAARRRHRGHRAHPQEADHRARAADRVCRAPRTPAIASPRSSAPASSRAAWR